jgi:hypothetical protein
MTTETPTDPKAPAKAAAKATPKAADATPSQLAVRAQSAMMVRPIQPAVMTIVGTFQSAGVRPIGAGHLILSGHMHDNRPVAASDPKFTEGSRLLGTRPIASNDMDDAATLMGYLD